MDMIVRTIDGEEYKVHNVNHVPRVKDKVRIYVFPKIEYTVDTVVYDYSIQVINVYVS